MIALGCTAPAPELDFLTGMLDYIDCQTQAIGLGGYGALAQPGSTLSLVLSGFLTLFVAFFGYRMLFGQTPGVRDGVLGLVKIGIVIALTASWPAYRTLVYDVILYAPAELAAEIATPAALPGSDGGLVTRLAAVDVNLVSLETLNTTTPAAPTVQVVNPTGGRGGGQQQPIQVQVQTAAVTAADASFLGYARILYLTGAFGALAAVRLVAGLLLAIGPFFIAFLLFEATRGLFEGWVRVLAGTALGSLGIAIVLGIELALLEPWVADILARRSAGEAITGVPVLLLVTTLVFALALLAMLIAAARVALGFRLALVWRSWSRQGDDTPLRDEIRTTRISGEPGHVPAEGRSRAAFVADAVAAAQRREAAPAAGRPTVMAVAGAAAGAPSRGVAAAPRTRDPAPATFTPIGQSFSSHRPRGRVSRSAGRRDNSQ